MCVRVRNEALPAPLPQSHDARRAASVPVKPFPGAPSGGRTFSKGVVRSVSLVPVASVAISQIVPLITYAGAYPTEPLTPGGTAPGPFNVTVRVRLAAAAAAATAVTVSASGSWGAAASVPAVVWGGGPSGYNESEVVVSLLAAAGSVTLWWPAGVVGGVRPLYTVNVSVTATATGETATATRGVGFRVFALVTDDDSEPARLANASGSGNLTMRFKVNGANIWSRGADIIPMEVLEGRSTAQAYTAMLSSAVAAGMNTLRIDGIDEYFPELLYDTADELGLLIYHDIQYSQAQPTPTNTTDQDAELRYQVRRGDRNCVCACVGVTGE